MNKISASLIVIILIFTSVYIVITPEKGSTTGSTINVNNVDVVENSEKENSDSNEIKTFVLEGENFKFIHNGIENPALKVNKGDTVRVKLTSIGGFHDWRLDEFNAATKKISVGESDFVEFVADKKGIFEYYCSVGQHRAYGMKGAFIVE